MCSAVPTTQKASQRYYCGFQHFLPYHLLLHKSSWIAWPSNLYQSFPFLQRTVTAATLTVLCILIRSSWTNRKGLFRTKHDVDCDSEASSPDHRGLLSRSRPNPKDWWHKTLQNSHLCWQANGIHRLILWTAQLKHNKRSRYACCEGKANSLFEHLSTSWSLMLNPTWPLSDWPLISKNMISWCPRQNTKSDCSAVSFQCPSLHSTDSVIIVYSQNRQPRLHLCSRLSFSILTQPEKGHYRQ